MLDGHCDVEPNLYTILSHKLHQFFGYAARRAIRAISAGIGYCIFQVILMGYSPS